MRNLYPLLLLTTLFQSCQPSSFQKAPSPTREVLAVVGADTLYQDQVDQIIAPQLNHILFQIYFTRKHAVDLLLEEKVLEREAKKYAVSAQDYKQHYIYDRITAGISEKYIQRFNFREGVPDRKNYAIRYPFNSPEGQQAMAAFIREYYYEDYLDSLKTRYQAEVFLTPPQHYGLNKQDKGIHQFAYPVNATQSSNEIVLITNPTCSECKKYYSFFREKIQARFKDQARISLVIVSDQVSPEVKLLEAARHQQKLAETYEFLQENKQELYQLEDRYVAKLLEKVPMDSTQFIKDVYDPVVHQQAQSSFEAIIKLGFVQTPALIINDQVVQDPHNLEEISKLLIPL